MTPILESKRLILRKYTLEDVKDMFNNWCNDPEVTKYLTFNHHESIEDTYKILNEWLKEYEENKDCVRYVIELKDTHELIGGIDIVAINNNIPEIGYISGRKYWNKGYMSEAVNIFLKELYRLGYKEVHIKAEIENSGSNIVILKNNGIFIGTFSKFLPLKNKTVLVNRYKILLDDK